MEEQAPFGAGKPLNQYQLDAAIASLPGDRVTRERIEARIVGRDFLRIGPTVTLCSLTLDNGYSVRGESACVDPANYRQEIGEKLAFDQAFNKLWPLFGFLLAEARHLRKRDRFEDRVMFTDGSKPDGAA